MAKLYSVDFEGDLVTPSKEHISIKEIIDAYTEAGYIISIEKEKIDEDYDFNLGRCEICGGIH